MGWIYCLVPKLATKTVCPRFSTVQPCSAGILDCLGSDRDCVQAPEGESQPSTEVDLFISTEKIMVLNTDLKVIHIDFFPAPSRDAE